MTDLLLGLILLIILLELHQKEKRTGWYGKLNVLIRKRYWRYIKNKVTKIRRAK